MLRPYSVLCRAWDCSAEALLASSNGEAGFLETWAPLVRGRRLKTPIIDRILRTPSEATNFYRFRFSAEDHLKIKINKNKTICNVKVKINYLIKWKCHTFNGFPTPKLYAFKHFVPLRHFCNYTVWPGQWSKLLKNVPF